MINDVNVHQMKAACSVAEINSCLYVSVMYPSLALSQAYITLAQISMRPGLSMTVHFPDHESSVAVYYFGSGIGHPDTHPHHYILYVHDLGEHGRQVVS